MPDSAPEFETIDGLGFTVQYQGTVGTSSIQVPSVAGFSISDAIIRCSSDNTPITKRLLWSIDNVTFHTLAPGEFVGWTFKKLIGTSTEIRQIYIKGNVAAVGYELIVNTEEN
jgi:hypothetical protein